jgi:hypothetical protein
MRWPSGGVSALIPLSQDRFIDRSYWVEVKIGRDPTGQPGKLIYDQFQGSIVNPQ